MNEAEAQLNRVRSSADTDSSGTKVQDMSVSRRARRPRGAKARSGKKKSSCMSEGTQRKPHPKGRLKNSEIKECGDARVHDRERQESSEHVKESSVPR